ncbi:hypothetical protein FNF28_03362 [Cafeteria roenbergensis]|uniref:Uncharacterized protein n=1 Tax=Cafeteria roenbergensis TaxID=33653 RepID=A0A5A8DKD6_CAFRO|nr:hypothetical protein FNF28_03362 [Cafeteria roenbergensis]
MAPLSPDADGGLRGESTLTLEEPSLPDWRAPGAGSTAGVSPMQVPDRASLFSAANGAVGRPGARDGAVAADDYGDDFRDDDDALAATGATAEAGGGRSASPSKRKKKRKRKVKRRKKKAKAAGSTGGRSASRSRGPSRGFDAPSAQSATLPPVAYGRRVPSSLAGGGHATASVPTLPLGGTAPAGLGSRPSTSASSSVLPRGRAMARGSRASRPGSVSSSRHSTGSRAIAGYVPPMSASDVSGPTMERAKEMVARTALLREAAKDPLFVEAAKCVGVAIDELWPRKAETFRQTMGTPRSSLKERKRFHDENRTLNIAIVLSHQDAAKAEADKLAERQRRMREGTAKDLLDRVARERARMEKAVMARERQRQVVERENERLRRVRRDYEEVLRREAEIQERRAAQFKARQEAVAERGREIAKNMAVVRARREEREAERLDGIRRTEEAKMARNAELARRHAEERQKRALRAKAKDQLLEERRDAAMSSQLKRREEMTKHLQAKEALLAAKEAERQAEVQRIRDERWVAEARAKANSERLRRQQAARREAKASLTMLGMEKQEMFGEVDLAIEKERRDIQKRRLMDEDKWREVTPLERTVMPGPGEYEFRRSADQNISTGQWRDLPPPEVQRLMSTKSWVDQTPGPGHYGAPDDSLTRSRAGGAAKFHDANPKSFLDWAAHRGKQLPAPSDYGRPSLVSPERSFAFSKHSPQGFIEHAAYLARDSPGPGGTLMSVSTPISPQAVMEQQRPATTGGAGMRRAVSFTAVPAPSSPIPRGSARASTSRKRPATTGGALVRAVSSAELRSSQGTQLVRRRSEREMQSELGTASRMKGLGASAKFGPSLGTVSKQLEVLVSEVAEEEDDEDEELDEVDAELIAAATRDASGDALTAVADL